MKGIPTFRPKRLKQAAVLTGVTALVAAASVLGSGVAHAASPVPVSDLGNGQGTLGISEQTGKTTDTLTFSSSACPSTANGSAEVEIADPLNPTNSQQLLAGVNNSVSSAFTFSSTGATDLSNAISGLFDDPAGGVAEIVVECFPQASGNGTGVFENDVFVQLDSTDSNFTVVPNPGTGTTTPTNVSVALTASPNPATSGSPVTLTATVTPSTATGTIQFENNGTNINATPATISGGTATTSTTFSGITSPTTETLTAVYTPTGNFAATSPGSLSLTVNPPAANSGTIPLAVSVPQSGSFSLTVDSKDVVTLTASGLSATGATTPITVADTRNSYPGWSVSGQDGAWTGTGTAAGGTFSGSQLGWAPTDTALAPGVSLGSPVTAGSPGLGSAAPLASVHAAMGNGYGTTTLGANLTLAIPATAPAGPYTSGLTISAVTTNP
jgi:hypothetical protein